MPFLYGNHVLKAHLGRITEDTPEHQGVVVFSMSDAPLVCEIHYVLWDSTQLFCRVLVLLHGQRLTHGNSTPHPLLSFIKRKPYTPILVKYTLMMLSVMLVNI